VLIGGSPRWVRFAVGVLVGWLAVGVLAATPASAHTTLRESSPAAGAALATAPDVVRLTFTGAVTAPRVEVLGPDGASFASGPVSGGGGTVQLPVRPGGPGRYTVRYAVLAADGHEVTGAFTFTVVGASATTSPPAPPAEGAVSSPGATQAAAVETSAPPAARGPGWLYAVSGLAVVVGLVVMAAGFLRGRVSRGRLRGHGGRAS